MVLWDLKIVLMFLFLRILEILLVAHWMKERKDWNLYFEYWRGKFWDAFLC
jgi:hypothetical protein